MLSSCVLCFIVTDISLGTVYMLSSCVLCFIITDISLGTVYMLTYILYLMKYQLQ
jgi:hypothetical protein